MTTNDSGVDQAGPVPGEAVDAIAANAVERIDTGSTGAEVVDVAKGPDATAAVVVDGATGEAAATLPPELAEAIEAVGEEFETISLAGCNVDSEDRRRLYRFVSMRLRLEEEYDRVKAQAAAMLRSIDSRMKGLDFVHLGYCEAMVKAELAAQSKGKKKPVRSIKTPFGTVGLRASGGGVVVQDEAAFLAVAETDKALTACVKTEKRVLVSEVGKYFRDTGDLPAGCDLAPEVDKFYVSAPRA